MNWLGDEIVNTLYIPQAYSEMRNFKYNIEQRTRINQKLQKLLLCQKSLIYLTAIYKLSAVFKTIRPVLYEHYRV